MKKFLKPSVDESTPLVNKIEDSQVVENELIGQKSSLSRGNITLKLLSACVILSLMLFVSLRYSSSMTHSIATARGNVESLIQ